MSRQADLLFDAISRERALAVSPARLERRRLANMLEALRCCSGRSAMDRLRGGLFPSATGC